MLLTGSTAVDVRQTLVDDFNRNETIPVFLLSTKAGGMGINLTAASVVVMWVDNSSSSSAINIWLLTGQIGLTKISTLTTTARPKIAHTE